jgi:hypothetical protein
MNVATPVDRKIKKPSTSLLVAIKILCKRALLDIENVPRDSNRSKTQTGSTSGRIFGLEVTLV